MFKKIKYFTVSLFCVSVIFYGFIKISNELPDFIKDRSNIKITYNKNPFDLKFDIGNYIIYINKEVFYNIKNKITN
ncbi:hypothetical protein SAMN05428976_102135 [Clostridium sp. USBA 49]|jgi:hypothetical protein|uniref:hypothetical protein n=1 Tax=Clostridium sp. USBA 49 TaxID=1881060 RepID=UPI00099A5D6E|nr:hypothetical protein [Clostridium sp. USBA 49]SKA75546.1 hypothetical protein SAMN05428976_102135 [Clostridium sp. USBA 49]